MSKFGRLQSVTLREAWPTEDGHFTPWLAKEENLAHLGEVLGMELGFEGREVNIGSFRADILCKNEDDSWVLIENQLEKTNHDHLGKILTYSAGLNAQTIIWIAEKFEEEHRAALDRQNEITDERFRYFGIEMKVWKIGNSVLAPEFNIVSKPMIGYHQFLSGPWMIGKQNSGLSSMNTFVRRTFILLFGYQVPRIL